MEYQKFIYMTHIIICVIRVHKTNLVWYMEIFNIIPVDIWMILIIWLLDTEALKVTTCCEQLQCLLSQSQCQIYFTAVRNIKQYNEIQTKQYTTSLWTLFMQIRSVYHNDIVNLS